MSDSNESKGMVSPGNLQTLVVVSFTLTLLAVALSFYNYTRTNQLFTGVVQLENASLSRDKKMSKNVKELGDGDAMAALEQRLAALEAKLAAPAGDAAAEAPPAADAAAAPAAAAPPAP